MTFMLDVHWPRDCAGNGWILEAKEEVNLTGLDLHLHVFLSMEFIHTKYIRVCLGIRIACKNPAKKKGLIVKRFRGEMNCSAMNQIKKSNDS